MRTRTWTAGKVIGWNDFVNGLPNPYDDNDHGTHVAATIAGSGDARADRLYRGAAYDGALVGLKVLDATGNGLMSNVTAAINWAVTNKATYGIEAINLSLGTSGCSNGGDATSLAVNSRAQRGNRRRRRGRERGAGHLHDRVSGRRRERADRRRDGRHRHGRSAGHGAERLLPGVVLEPRQDARRPDQAGRLRAGSRRHVGATRARRAATSHSTARAWRRRSSPGLHCSCSTRIRALTPTQVKSIVTGTAIDWARGGDNKTAGTTGQDIDYGYGRLDGYAAIEAAKGSDIGTAPDVASTRVPRGNARRDRAVHRLHVRGHVDAVPDRGDAHPSCRSTAARQRRRTSTSGCSIRATCRSQRR